MTRRYGPSAPRRPSNASGRRQRRRKTSCTTSCARAWSFRTAIAAAWTARACWAYARLNAAWSRRSAAVGSAEGAMRQVEHLVQVLSRLCSESNLGCVGDPGTPAGMGLRIGELSRRVGVTPDLLRAWERRYELLRPQRSRSGQRLYTDADEARVRRMLGHMDRGYSPAVAARLAAQAPPPPAPPGAPPAAAARPPPRGPPPPAPPGPPAGGAGAPPPRPARRRRGRSRRPRRGAPRRAPRARRGRRRGRARPPARRLRARHGPARRRPAVP